MSFRADRGPAPSTSLTVIAVTPDSVSALLTSSSLNGRMTASIIFMPIIAPERREPDSARARSRGARRADRAGDPRCASPPDLARRPRRACGPGPRDPPDREPSPVRYTAPTQIYTLSLHDAVH